jgi:(2R)-ethylmalonyl-CoA mutase
MTGADQNEIGGSPELPTLSWLPRTYAGHTDIETSNKLYADLVASGQHGLSVAYDLPSQLGLDADNERAVGEVGKVGVPVSNLDDMQALFDGIPMDEVNTSMTINATAPWMLALYVATAEERGIDPSMLRGTTQNDLIKEFVARGNYFLPPEPSLQLQSDVIEYATANMPWNPLNFCSYHYPEAGSSRIQEVAYTFFNAFTVLDGFRPGSERVERSGISTEQVIGRMSFFLNSNSEFFEELAKITAMKRIWHEQTDIRYGVQDEKARRFRFGVQTNSVDLPAQRPELNIPRIAISAMAAILGGARAIQLPAYTEALGIPTQKDQELSRLIQYILGLETNIDQHKNIMDGSDEFEEMVDELVTRAELEIRKLEDIRDEDGLDTAIDYMRDEIAGASYTKQRDVENGERKVVGVNVFRPDEDDGSSEGLSEVVRVDPKAEAKKVEELRRFKEDRSAREVRDALDALKTGVEDGENIIPISIAAAKSGVTTGEWSGVLLETFGEHKDN